jgi:hypothetical protein
MSTKKRAARIAAPGAKRLTLTGLMAVPDDFGRVRVLLMNPLPSGAPSRSADVLRAELPAGEDLPYATHPRDPGDVIGEFWAVVPARYKKHWLAVAADLRGKEVRVEVTVRFYSYVSRNAGRTTPTDEEKLLRGVALDVALIEPLPPGKQRI